MLLDRTSCNSERQTGVTVNLWGRIVQTPLTLILLTWRKWWASNNASRWQMGFNSALKRTILRSYIGRVFGHTHTHTPTLHTQYTTHTHTTHTHTLTHHTHTYTHTHTHHPPTPHIHTPTPTHPHHTHTHTLTHHTHTQTVWGTWGKWGTIWRLYHNILVSGR